MGEKETSPQEGRDSSMIYDYSQLDTLMEQAPDQTVVAMADRMEKLNVRDLNGLSPKTLERLKSIGANLSRTLDELERQRTTERSAR